MAIQELIEKLKSLSENGCKEMMHIAADELLLEYINNKEVTEIFQDMQHWYA